MKKMAGIVFLFLFVLFSIFIMFEYHVERNGLISFDRSITVLRPVEVINKRIVVNPTYNVTKSGSIIRIYDKNGKLIHEETK